MVVRLILIVRNKETETAALEVPCAVHSEAVVKFGKRLGCDRCRRQPPAAWQVLALEPSFWNVVRRR